MGVGSAASPSAKELLRQLKMAEEIATSAGPVADTAASLPTPPGQHQQHASKRPTPLRQVGGRGQGERDLGASLDGDLEKDLEGDLEGDLASAPARGGGLW